MRLVGVPPGHEELDPGVAVEADGGGPAVLLAPEELADEPGHRGPVQVDVLDPLVRPVRRENR